MKFRSIFKVIFSTALASVLMFSGCTRKKVDYLGPEYLSAPEDFTASNLVINPSSMVDFTSGVCNITATFSTRVTYYITITGQSSGAVKKFTGVNDKIEASSEGGTWNGSHDGLYFFRSGETVDIKITFLRSDIFLAGTTTIANVRNYFTSPMLLALGGNTKNSYETSATTSGFPFQFSFSEALNTSEKFAERTLASAYDINAIDGQYVLRIAGKSQQPDGFFVGGLQHRQGSQMAANGFLLPATWTDPSQIYFNVYVYGSGKSNATVNLEFHESDASNPYNDKSGNNDTIKIEGSCSGGSQTLNQYGHDPCTDDGWVYPIPVNFTGWKLISVKYSDFPRSVSTVNGGNGNQIKEPTRVARIQMGVVSAPAFKVAEVMFDYPVISYGAPFDPSK